MFLDIQEQIKNQKLSDYEITDFVFDYANDHIDSTQKDSVIDFIMDCIKDTKNSNHKYSTHQLKDTI